MFRLGFFIGSLFILFQAIELSAQCTVSAFASRDTVVCGGQIILSAFGQGQGEIIFSENFNSGSPTGWAFTQQATFNNPCSPGDGTTHIWMGNNSPVPRELRTQTYNLSNATAGVTICFDLLFATQGQPAPCEGPDEPDEGVYLQYSTDGVNWVTIHYFNPNGGYDPQLTNWNNWCFDLPAAAISTTTRIRWFQDNDSGADYDHWGIDNVNIYFNDPTYEIVWQHDGYNHGPTGGINPNHVNLYEQTTYNVVMTNGTEYCYDSVTVFVKYPQVTAFALYDTLICQNECIQLSGTADVMVSPAKVITYANNEFQVISSVFGSSTAININVPSLNMEYVEPGSILSVCITNLTFYGVGGFPPSQVGIGALEITLVCPDGNEIFLVPSGVTSSTLTQGYNQTCFTTGGNNIAAYSTPYTGNFSPNQPLSNMVGCSAQGIWTMKIRMTSNAGYGSGTFFGWSITFDDPELSYQGEVYWQAAHGLSDTLLANPTVCPSTSTTYTLVAHDTAQCVFATDQVTVNTYNCCFFTFNADVVHPTCAANTGAINLHLDPPNAAYNFSWSNGGNTQTLSNLAQGHYTVTISDGLCTVDTTIVLNLPPSPAIELLDITHESCSGSNDGQIEVSVSGGTPPYVYAWSNASAGTIATNLTGGLYALTVTDQLGCADTFSVQIETFPEMLLSFTAESAICGGSNGSATVIVTHKFSPYFFK